MRTTLHLGWLSALALALVVATPRAWAQPRSLTIARVNHGAALLPDGRVLIAGGEDVDRLYEMGAGARGSVLRSSAIFDPRTNAWTGSGPLRRARTNVTAVALPDGRVVALGGGTDDWHLEAEVETWSPRTGQWQPGGSLASPRRDASATLLVDGRVLIVGGIGPLRSGAASTTPALSSVELWDPTALRTLAAAALPVPLAGHAAVRLGDGRVLVTGGRSAIDGAASARSFVWDPRTDAWTETLPMTRARVGHSAALLADGRVLIVGNAASTRTACGPTDGAACLSAPIDGDAADLFDPATMRFAATGVTHQPRLGEHRIAVLADGRVAVFGAYEPDQNQARVVEVWSPGTGAWQDAGDAPLAGLAALGVTALRDGRVLLVGARMAPNTRGQMRAASAFLVWDPRTAPVVTPPRPSRVRRAALE